MKVKDAYTIGDAGLHLQMHEHAFHWLNMSRHIMEAKETADSVSYTLNEKVSLLDALANASLQVRALLLFLLFLLF